MQVKLADPYLHVLVIEDDEDYAVLIKDLLNCPLFSVTHCTSLASGLEALKSVPVDVVILDLGLPDGVGPDNLTHVRSVNQLVPVVIVTADDDQTRALKLVQMGAQDYLVKGEFNDLFLRRTLVHAHERQLIHHELQTATTRAVEEAVHASVISNLGRIVSSTSDMAIVMDRFAAQAGRLLPFDRLAIALIDSLKHTVTERYVVGVEFVNQDQHLPLPFEGSVTQKIVSTHGGAILTAEEIRNHYDGSGRAKAADSLMRSGLVEFACVPLQNHGEVIGIVTIGSFRPSTYSDVHLKLLNEIADQISGSVNLAENLAQMQDLANRQSTLAALAKEISGSLMRTEVIRASNPYLQELLPAKYIAINLVDRQRNTFIRQYITGEELPGYPESDDEPLNGSTTEEVVMANSMRLLNAQDILNGASNQGLKPAAEAGIRSVMVVPLKVEGRAIGTITWADFTDNRFTPYDVDLAATISMHIAGALANCELHERSLKSAEERITYQQLEATNRELSVANEVKARIISNVSHELRTPLTSMLAFADMLNRDRDACLTDSYKVMVKMIRRAGRQLDFLISDLLTMSRLQTGDFKLSYGTFNVSEFIGESVNLFASIAESKNQTVEVYGIDPALEVEADRSRISQVLLNVMSNASKYSPDGSVIEVNAHIRKGNLDLRVVDHGNGMSPEELSMIFKRFARLDNDATRSEQGTGLGLHIVNQIVQMHHGNLDVSSEQAKGTAFTVTIPLKQPEQQLEEAA